MLKKKHDLKRNSDLFGENCKLQEPLRLKYWDSLHKWVGICWGQTHSSIFEKLLGLLWTLEMKKGGD